MRRLYAVLTGFILLSLQTVSAQSAPSFGLRGGVTIANLSGDAMNNLNSMVDLSGGMVTSQPRTGFHAGGFVNLPLSPIVSLEPGLYYAQKGYRMQGDLEIKALDFLGANASAELQSSYIDAPLLLKVNVISGLQLFAGPQVSYLIKNNVRVDAGALGLSLFKRNMDVTDNFKKWDMALTGGIGYEFVNGFNIRASYDHGLSRVDANSRLKSYNTAVKVGLGFRF